MTYREKAFDALVLSHKAAADSATARKVVLPFFPEALFVTLPAAAFANGNYLQQDVVTGPEGLLTLPRDDAAAAHYLRTHPEVAARVKTRSAAGVWDAWSEAFLNAPWWDFFAFGERNVVLDAPTPPTAYRDGVPLNLAQIFEVQKSYHYASNHRDLKRIAATFFPQADSATLSKNTNWLFKHKEAFFYRDVQLKLPKDSGDLGAYFKNAPKAREQVAESRKDSPLKALTELYEAVIHDTYFAPLKDEDQVERYDLFETPYNALDDVLFDEDEALILGREVEGWAYLKRRQLAS